MTDPIIIEIAGVPVAKARARVVNIKGRVRAFTPKNTVQWENDARLLARMEMKGREPFTGPMRMGILAVFPIPVAWPGWKKRAAKIGRIMHTGRPDGDNIAKAAKDAMNKIVWADDSQVVDMQIIKVYGFAPMVRIEVELLPAAPSQIKNKIEFEAYHGSR